LTSKSRSVAVIGAGFSGTLLALHLVRVGPPDLRVILIERTGGFGRGLAYGTHNPRHLLNVRVANMSAWPDQPDHLALWLAEQPANEDGGLDFISRGAYGRYIASQLQEAIAQPDGAQRLLLVPDEAVGLDRHPSHLRLKLALGNTLDVDLAVLATGHPPSAPPEGVGLEALPPQLYADDPWAAQALEGLDPDASVLLLGSGLTMIDVALSLEARGHRGPILALSRRGLAPRRHSGPPARTAVTPAADEPLSRRVATLRRRAREVGWRHAVDELRPSTQAIWLRAGPVERRRFLRHLQPWWDVHRHRMAPTVADWFDRQLGGGRLGLVAGRLLRAEETADSVEAVWRPRGETLDQTLRVGRIINCTGPGGDPARSRDPLLRQLLSQGMVRADPMGLGLDVQPDGRLVDAAGAANNRLYAVGPVSRSAVWEIIAVPDIRNQVVERAALLSLRLAAPRG
jgi:uncharacterized NAD(P)/FAD-binding protein YdhS